MNPDSRPTPPAVVLPAINYLKLTLSLLAVVMFHHLLENWADFKAGLIGGWHHAQRP